MSIESRTSHATLAEATGAKYFTMQGGAERLWLFNEDATYPVHYAIGAAPTTVFSEWPPTDTLTPADGVIPAGRAKDIPHPGSGAKVYLKTVTGTTVIVIGEEVDDVTPRGQ